MAQRLAQALHKAIEEVAPRLTAIPEEHAAGLYGSGWTRKEELGHLIDSASNNHQRFVRASLEGGYEGPTYQQKEWVAMHGYQEMPWTDLVEFWRRYNSLLERVVERIPEDRLAAPCSIGPDSEEGDCTLEYLIEDYIVHMRHHLEHLLA